MPVNKKSGESKSDFLSRCIPHEIKKGHPQDQSLAMCESMWETAMHIEQRLIKVKEYRACKPKKK